MIWLAALLAAAPPAGTLTLPVQPACVSSPFGPRRAVGPHAALMHYGVDLPAPPGAWVMAAAAGRVAAIRHLGADGLEIDIDHGDYVTRYAHLGTVAPALAEGRAQVAAGERIGRVGRTGITYGTHLHFEIRVDGVPIDPQPLLGVTPCARSGPPPAGE